MTAPYRARLAEATLLAPGPATWAGDFTIVPSADEPVAAVLEVYGPGTGQTQTLLSSPMCSGRMISAVLPLQIPTHSRGGGAAFQPIAQPKLQQSKATVNPRPIIASSIAQLSQSSGATLAGT